VRVAAVLLLGALAGCSSVDSVFSSKSSTTSSTGSVSLGNRIAGFITGQGSGSSTPSEAPSTPTSEDFECPRIDIRPGASTLLVNVPSPDQQAMGLKYQGIFVRAARECRVRAPDVTIKVGVQGRIIVGPAGGPGVLTVPLRYALVQESVGQSRTIWTKLYTVPVTISGTESNVTFTHIQEDLTVPIPSPADLDQYVIYIGYDPSGAAPEIKKKPGKSAPKPRAARTG
jgi:hypothetical protein